MESASAAFAFQNFCLPATFSKILSYITHVTPGAVCVCVCVGGGVLVVGRGVGRRRGTKLELVSVTPSCSLYERAVTFLAWALSNTSLCPLLHLPARFHTHRGHLLAVASLQLPDGPRLPPDVHQSRTEFNICSMLRFLEP